MGTVRNMAALQTPPLLPRLFNKQFWYVVVVSGCIYAVFSGAGLVSGNFLPIKAIEVTGQFQGLKINNLERAIAGHVNAGFFGADMNAIKLAAEQLPWADSVSVRRVWPDKIQLEVTEQNAIARWGESSVMNDDGMLFYPESGNIPNNLTQLNGPEGTHRLLLSHLTEIQPMLAKQGLMVTRLEFDDRRALELELNNGVRLLAGRVRDVREVRALVNRFVQAWAFSLADRAKKISSVDLRYTNGFSIQWKSGVASRARPKGKQKKLTLGQVSRGLING